MPNKPGTIDWKKRLEAMKQGQAKISSPPVASAPEAPIQELFSSPEVPDRKPEPEPDLALRCASETKCAPQPQPEPETDPAPESGVAQQIKPTGMPPEPALSVPDPHGGRLDNLERQIRRLKLRGNLALSLAILLLLGFAVMMVKSSERGGRMSAANLTISDAQGVSRAWIGEREGQVQVELRDQAGHRRLTVGLSAAGDPRLIFYNKDQQILSAITPRPEGQAGIELLNPLGESVATLPGPSPNPPSAPEPQALTPEPAPIPAPAPAPQKAPQVEQKSATKPEAAIKATADVMFVANPGGKSYHFPSSPWVKNTPPNQLLKFSSAAEAEKAGFHSGRDIRPGHKD